jgi:hypothetical protein
MQRTPQEQHQVEVELAESELETQRLRERRIACKRIKIKPTDELHYPSSMERLDALFDIMFPADRQTVN